MKNRLKCLPCFTLLFLIAAFFITPVTCSAAEPLVIGVLHTEKYASAPDYHGAEAYSALLVAADVLKRADSFSSESIRATLDQTDMMTPFGPVKFKSYEKFERQNRLPTQALQIIKGKFECVWPPAHAASNFIAPSYWRASD